MDFFNKKFSDERIPAEYVNFELPALSELPKILRINRNLRGLNVTIPYKEKIIPYLDSIDSTASEIGAVNVIKIDCDNNGNQCLTGYNSDIVGFTDSIAPILTSEHKKALILGTGGASKAVYAGLHELGLSPVLVSRTPGAHQLTYGDLTHDIIAEHTVIVNTTPLGMSPRTQACPDIPYRFISAKHICYDLVYNPEVTLFMTRCAEQGATVKNGLEMLHRQALAAWHIWNKE